MSALRYSLIRDDSIDAVCVYLVDACRLCSHSPGSKVFDSKLANEVYVHPDTSAVTADQAAAIQAAYFKRIES